MSREPDFVFFLFLNESICCGYSMEASRRDASIEYPQQMFSLMNTEDIAIVVSKEMTCTGLGMTPK